MEFKHIKPPEWGERIEVRDGKLDVPDSPIILFIRGDGIGPEIVSVMQKVLDEAISLLYRGKKRIAWTEAYAGEMAQEKYGTVLPEETVEAIRTFYVAIKGPLTTPVAGGYRSLNVTMRQRLDLYANVRPSRYFKGVPSPVAHPEKVNMVVFRENTEDVYAGIEWRYDSEEAGEIRKFLKEKFDVTLREDAGIGIKPISEFCTKRLVRKAIKYAIERGRRSVTLVHKGNIMKYTEGAFRDWGYEVARDEFGDITVTEAEVMEKYGGKVPEGKIVIKDRIADNMFQQILTRANEYEVIATPNLNGDYLSDAIAAQVGGLGIAPGANIGDYHALFEPVHGTAPKYAGKNVINPTSQILSGVMMLEHLGWFEAAEIIYEAIERTISEKKVTYDLARHMEGVEPIGTREYGDAIIENMRKIA
jgi:isocitrate dehydrogenase